MASSTRYGGASYTPEELADPDLPAVIIRRAELGRVDTETYNADDERGAESSDGNNSDPYSKKQQKPAASRKPSPRRPAQTTVSHSNPQDAETGSTARSTGGAGQSSRQSRSDDAFDFDDDDFS